MYSHDNKIISDNNNIEFNNNNNIDNTNNFIQWGNEHITSSETSKLEDVKKYIWSEIPNLTGTDP